MKLNPQMKRAMAEITSSAADVSFLIFTIQGISEYKDTDKWEKVPPPGSKKGKFLLVGRVIFAVFAAQPLWAG